MSKESYFDRYPFAEIRSQDGTSSIKICINGYQYPEIKLGEDADWYNTYIYLEIPGFRAEIDEPMFQAGDLANEIRELHKFSKIDINETSIAPMDEYLHLDFSFNSQKKVVVDGVLEYPLGWGANLRFSFETDLTYVDQFIQQLENIVELYPSR